MIYKKILLKDAFQKLNQSSYDPSLSVYIAENSVEIKEDLKSPAVVICPGGGYGYTSDREAEPVALRFLSQGYQAFVLRYSPAPNRYPIQLLELSAAVAYIRRNADLWNIDTDKIAICGFSAGAHLVGTLGNHWNESFIQDQLQIKTQENKPNAMILSYPVITGGEFAHKGSFENLLGEQLNPQTIKERSLENTVNAYTPPTFLWHTLDDDCVPVQNTLTFVDALVKENIPLELHIYPKGVHGLALADESTANKNSLDHINPHAASWFDLAIKWLNITL